MATITLKKPVTGTDDRDGSIINVTALTLREPTGKDIRSCGVPFTVGEGNAVAMDAEAIAKLIGALSGQPPFVVDRLSAADWTAAMGAVMGFFGASIPAKP